MKRVYTIFGSFEIFGNPSSFFSELKKGFYNFLIVPFNELKEKKGLKSFGKKVAVGTKSFAVSIVKAIFNFSVTIVESIIRYVDYFTWDDQFRYTRQKLRDKGVSGVVDGVRLGFQIFRFGRHPFDSAVTDSLLSVCRISKYLYLEKGLFRTIVQAPIKIILSLALKPPLGTYDFFFCCFKGIIMEIFSDNSSLKFRRRPPRIFGEANLIIPYNYDHAVGNDYIKRLGYKVSKNEEFKYFETSHFRINGTKHQYAIIMTDKLLYAVIVLIGLKVG
jgi:hypothetical protein